MAAELAFYTDADLTRLNTLGLQANARYLAKVSSESALLKVLKSVTAQRLPIQILGGGSNLVLANDVHALVAGVQAVVNRKAMKNASNAYICSMLCYLLYV